LPNVASDPDLPPISVHWHEGNKPNIDQSYKGADGTPTQTRPNLPAAFAQLEQLDPELAKSRSGAGDLFVGEKGIITCGSHGGAPVLLPVSRRTEFTLPPKTLPRPSGGIMGDFLL
jgi:hypothetical protein